MTGFRNYAGGATIEKAPGAALDYEVDWSQWLGIDTISSVTWTVPAGLTLQSQTNTATAATVWLAGGTIDTDYVVTCRIQTAAGRIDERAFTVMVKRL
jgi:hypothetical protein